MKQIYKLTNDGIILLLSGYKGYDTFGPFKLVGDIAKGHPDDKDIRNAVEFVKDL